MTDPRLRTFRQLAIYNRLANERLYDACQRLSAQELAMDRRAFFGSILGTLNHLLIGDEIWMTRFEGGEIPSTGLDEVLHTEFELLHVARQRMDARIEGFFSNVGVDFLDATIRYQNNEARVFDDPIPMLIIHFFNHQTHHRGQVHAMLTQTSVAPPVLDFHRVLKPEPESALPV
ncbi:MAG: DinB family protein [Alphaproteobacteria bacterium]